MKYNNIELKEVDSVPKDFTPHKMLCWTDNSIGYVSEYIIAIVKRSDDILFISDHSIWPHGADIPEEPKPRRATNRELSRWLAQGNGEWCMTNGTGQIGSNTNYGYSTYKENQNVTDGVLVRKWEDNEWHEPTAEYMGIE